MRIQNFENFIKPSFRNVSKKLKTMRNQMDLKV